jgi:hypothetical protein
MAWLSHWVRTLERWLRSIWFPARASPRAMSYSSSSFCDDVSTIPDVNVQRAFTYLHSSLQELNQQTVSVVTLLKDIKSDTASCAHKLTTAPSSGVFVGASHEGTPIVPSPHPLPLMIMARSNSDASESFGETSSATGSAPDPAIPYLKCPFCSHHHDNEKSHVQHLHRLFLRLGLLVDLLVSFLIFFLRTSNLLGCYSSKCVIPESHHVLRGFTGTHVERCSEFLGTYCSKLASGNVRNINPSATHLGPGLYRCGLEA